MNTNSSKPALIIGGSGIVGSRAVETLRKLYPDLPIAVGGRDLAKAQAVAARFPNTTAVRVDLDQADLALPAGAGFSALAVFVKDYTLNSMRYAQRKGLPHITVSSGVYEVGPEMALAISKPDAAPVLMASNWLAGAATFPAIRMARQFSAIDSIRITVVLDEEDMGGPAAYADFVRLTESAPSPLQLVDGRWHWADKDEARRSFTDVDGTAMEATGYAPLDVLSLSTATNAKSIRVDLVYGTSASRRRGEAFSTEIAIEMEGTPADGGSGKRRLDIVHPQGQAPLTALHVALAVERALGLRDGQALKPGLFLPESIMDADYVVAQMKAFGTIFKETR
ncbi:NAD(P)-dependent oxidoreductase [Phyllobacterium sp. 21LDTY02-6]|uniref:NAD(P)-dependent oxidoreductase n=1 Tax=Phyllobacterium sp. 21LDTY02-6 TaxID=2944903 RepID=UPI002022932B|nr:NAD(P)-dependent oxidoreductase [Phyllobacterium sp. 21LDTY02-6]MCO4315835.1 NAD(P)-dependent oxidoreductase [Phyllobacterium sp. 21LDTY02-6]